LPERLFASGVSSFQLVPRIVHGKLVDPGDETVTHDFRIAKVQRTLRWFEEDIPLLNMRVKELSKERQETAKKFAAAVIEETRAELERLLRETPEENDCGELPCEPAD
jgi:hypothetical protein